MNRPVPSRRDLLRYALAGTGIAALGPVGRGLSRAHAGSPSTKRLVVVHLDGGLDGPSLLVPRTLPSYFSRRPTIAIPDAASLSLAGGPGGTAHRLHPAMPNLKALWDDGDVAFVHRVGYPEENLSHFESGDIFAYGVRGGTTSFLNLGITPSGWMARLADAHAPTPLGAVSLGMGRPTHLVGGSTPTVQVGSLWSFQFYPDWYDYNGHARRKRYARDVLALAGAAGAEGEVRASLLQAHDLEGQIQTATEQHDTFLDGQGLAYPDSWFAGRLSDAATLMHAGFETRTILTSTGGYDTHGDQGGATGWLADRLKEVDDAIGAFAADLKAQGRWDDTVLALYSEFGRRSYENASGGTDHGGACEMILVGGALTGGHFGVPMVDADLQDEYPLYAVDFRDVFRKILSNHLGMDPATVFPEAQPLTSPNLGFL